MAESHFVYKLEGDVKEIDVYQLAPTLLALGDLIQESNRQVFPEGREIGVNVKPFREGSFVVDLTLFSPTTLQRLMDFLTPHSLEQLKTLLETIGIVMGGVGASATGAVQVVRFLRGKPKRIEEVRPGEFRYTANDDRSITVQKSVHALLANTSVTQNIYKIYGPPMLSQDSIVDVKTYLQGDEANAVVVKREDVSIIREFASPSSVTTPAINETVKETVHNGVFLNPKRGAFGGDDPKDWSFFRGEEVITVTIKDRDFLTQVGSGAIRLNTSDLLTVDLLERQKVRGTIVQKPTYELLKVVDYQKGSEQKSMNDSLPLGEIEP